jgi:outer membrane protein assembly factor BamE (lipoprotein component of BamABCDE complex)
MPTRSARILACLAVFAAGGCAQMTQPFDTFIPIVTQFGVYKIDINQGNYISQDMVDQL